MKMLNIAGGLKHFLFVCLFEIKDRPFVFDTSKQQVFDSKECIESRALNRTVNWTLSDDHVIERDAVWWESIGCDFKINKKQWNNLMKLEHIQNRLLSSVERARYVNSSLHVKPKLIQKVHYHSHIIMNRSSPMIHRPMLIVLINANPFRYPM